MLAAEIKMICQALVFHCADYSDAGKIQFWSLWTFSRDRHYHFARFKYLLHFFSTKSATLLHWPFSTLTLPLFQPTKYLRLDKKSNNDYYHNKKQQCLRQHCWLLIRISLHTDDLMANGGIQWCMLHFFSSQTGFLCSFAGTRTEAENVASSDDHNHLLLARSLHFDGPASSCCFAPNPFIPQKKTEHLSLNNLRLGQAL